MWVKTPQKEIDLIKQRLKMAKKIDAERTD